MPITVNQKWEGSKLAASSSDASIKSEYVIDGTNDEFTAYNSLDSATALLVGGLIKKNVRITERL